MITMISLVFLAVAFFILLNSETKWSYAVFVISIVVFSTILYSDFSSRKDLPDAEFISKSVNYQVSKALKNKIKIEDVENDSIEVILSKEISFELLAYSRECDMPKITVSDLEDGKKEINYEYRIKKSEIDSLFAKYKDVSTTIIVSNINDGEETANIKTSTIKNELN